MSLVIDHSVVLFELALSRKSLNNNYPRVEYTVNSISNHSRDCGNYIDTVWAYSSNRENLNGRKSR